MDFPVKVGIKDEKSDALRKYLKSKKEIILCSYITTYMNIKKAHFQLFVGTLISVIAAIFVIATHYLNKKETFATTAGTYPQSVDLPILNSYRYSGRKNVSDKSASDIWWYYPSFGVGSFEQLTNNLKYWYNPDEGTCSRSDMCGALYKNNHNVPSNVVSVLPPVPNDGGARVGYFNSEPNLLFVPREARGEIPI